MRSLLAALSLPWVLLVQTPTQATRSLAALNVHWGDLPANFLPYSNQILTPGQWDVTERDAAGTAAKAGLTSISFEVFYVGALSKHSLGTILAHYVSPAAARLAYLHIVASIVKAYLADARPLVAPDIGDERYGFIDPVPSKAVTALYFWRGEYVASTLIRGNSNQLSPALTVRLAGIVDGRIQHAR